jgi:lipopolysaccharide transport system permease protein
MSDFAFTVNPHASNPCSLASLIQSLSKNRALIFKMTQHEVLGRYKGSVIGMAWSFFNPIFMLSIYTFVFSVVFKSRWQVANEPQSKTQFAVILFTGLIALNLMSEVLNRAPGLILSNVNYVKKVVFPLEILPLVAIMAALFHSLVSINVLLAAFAVFNGFLHWTAIFLPLVMAPFVVLISGLAWLLASLGVYLRDIGQSIGLITTVMMFVSPVFYPITAVPEKYRPVVMLNPPSFIIEQLRKVLVWGELPDFRGLTVYFLIALAVAWAGYAWFQKTRKGFADVL